MVMMLWLSKFIRFLIVAYLVISSILWLTQDILLFPLLKNKLSSSSFPNPPESIDSFFVNTDDGERLQVWTTYGKDKNLTSPYIGIIFHGNGETVAERNYLPFFAGHRIQAFTFDYRGYGNSTGWPSEEKLLKDSKSIWHAIQQKTGVDASHVIILGNSIGAGPASYLASEINPHALILIAGYANVPEILRDLPWYRPFSWILRYEFPNAQNLKKLRSHCVILAHGRKDNLINIRHLELLQKSLTPANVDRVIPLESIDASHNDIFYAVEEKLNQKLDECL